MGSPSPASPVTQTTQISQMDPRLYQWLYGTANSPGRQQIANAAMLGKTMQGVQNADPTALAAFYNVPKGTDLAQFQSHTGAMNPGQTDRALMQLPGQSITPQDYYKQATAGEKEEKKSPTSTAIAAEGGELDAYAQGGRPKPKAEQLAQPTADLNEYGLTASQQRQFDKYENMRNSGKKFTQQQIKDYNSMKDARTQYAQANPNATKGKTPLSLADAQIGVTPFFYVNPNDPNDPRNMTSTNPYYNRAVDVLRGMETLPGQYGQAGDAYSKLQNMANYAPQQVTGKDANAAQMAQYQQISAQKADTERAVAAAMNRGDVREVNALMAQVEKYDAALMNAPADIKAQAYEAAQTQGPQSWTDVGTAQKFMNPYMQNVTDIAKRESMRDYGKQLSQLRSEATGRKAFGGTRSAIQEAEAQRNQQQRMGDIQAQGLNEAYKSGMGQFSAEQGLGAQVGISNTQAMNQQRSQYVAQALEAAKNNYGGQLTAEQQNQVAQNAARQFNASAQNLANNNYVAQQLQAQLANQQMDFNVGQMNTQNQQAANMYNAQAQNQANQNYVQQLLAAQQSNQQAGLTTEQQNAQMRQQANMANQLYGVGGFNAQQANQNAGLQANQQNIGAMGQAGQGLLNVGQGIGSYNQNLLQNWGAAGNTLQNLAQGYYDKRQQSAQNIWGGVNTATQPATGTLLGSPWGTSYQGQYQQRKKGGKLSIKV